MTRLRSQCKTELLLHSDTGAVTKIKRVILRRGTYDRRGVVSLSLWSAERGECAARLGEKELAELVVLLFKLILTNRRLKQVLKEPLKERLQLDIDALRVVSPIDRAK